MSYIKILNEIKSSQIKDFARRKCPNCTHERLSPFYEVQNVPVHSCLMMSTKQEALDFPRGNIVLGFCERCGFITNLEFDSKWSAYAPNYEDRQSFSPTFNRFAFHLANRLIREYQLYDKDILEIGCGKGDFLLLLCELGHNRGVGIDPSVVCGRVETEVTHPVTFIQDYYSERHARYVGDLICCRHTLEHIYPTAEFVRTVRHSIGDRLNVSVFFEVPDTTRVLQKLAFEDIYYEHCSYFTPGSLARLFRFCGFEIARMYRAYDEQYLLLEAKPVVTPSHQLNLLEESVENTTQNLKHFVDRIGTRLDRWQQYLQNMKKQNKRIVVWGSGSKCVSFLTTLDTEDLVDYVVDINPYRHGKFIPGVAKQIMPPEFLKTYKPDRVIVMNSIYCNEIQKMLENMNISTEVISL